MYLDSLFAKDPHLASDYSDRQVELSAEYDPQHFLDYLRASNYYSLERVSPASFTADSYRHFRFAKSEIWCQKWCSS
jgi:hypothetical protein